MRVLLLGEYSSLHKFLKEGLQELGIDVTLAANGDGWKQIKGADTVLYGMSRNKVSRAYHRLIEPYYVARQFKNYDVVQAINTKIYSHRINTNIIRKIKKRNKIFSLLATGTDYRLYQSYLDGQFKYYIFDYEKPEEYTGNNKYSQCWIKNDLEIEKLSDIIIPTMYDYCVGYCKNKKQYKAIPLPINTKEINYTQNDVKDKLVFFHGISRPLIKGTPFICKALERLEEKYPNDVRIVIKKRIPYDKYINIISKVNVLLDQCCSYSYGINACISMAQGKVVLSGNSEENRAVLGIEECPIIGIKPDVEQIYSKLCYVLENKNRIAEIGYKSRAYVEKNHNHVKVAKQYIEAWDSVKDK